MFELLNLLVDFIVLRDQGRKHQLRPRMLVAGGVHAVILYAVALPAALLYINHPGNRLDESVFFAAIVFLLALTISLIMLTLRWRRELRDRPAQAARGIEPTTIERCRPTP